MYRLLVVDDEPMIVEGICNVIEENNRWELELYKTCLGEEALRILKTSRMDIVMTDIRMPAVSGLDLMREIKKEWPHCKIIFLTAFEEFDYAYTAAKDSGVRFLLKAEGYGAILEVIGECVNAIDAELQAEELKIRSGRQDGVILALRRNDFLRDVLSGGKLPAQGDFDALGLNFNPLAEVYALVCDSLERGPRAYEQAEVIRTMLVSLTDGGILCEICMLENNTAVWIIQSVSNRPDLPKILADRLEIIQGLQDAAPSFVLSGAPCGWDSLAAEFKRLKSLLGMRLAVEGGFVYTAASGADTGGGYLRLAEECKKEIELLNACVETGNKELFLQKLNGICQTMPELFNGHAEFGRETAIQLNLFFLLCKNRLGPSANRNKVFNRLSEFDLSFPFQYGVYAEMSGELFRLRADTGQNLLHDCVEIVKTYIDANLHGDISLTKLADVAHFNPKYLSRLFGERTGTNLSNYIAGKRLEKAKRLIRENEMKMQDISAAVGFLTPSYFTRFFKKATGFSPQQYREHSAANNVDKG